MYLKLKLDERLDAKDAWLKQVKHHRKRLKGLPRVGFNPNAGNVEHNISMINQMLGSGEMLSNNPISGPFGGDISAPSNGMSMGESLNEAVYDGMELGPGMARFLEENIDLIDLNDFTKLYFKLPGTGLEPQLTSVLIYSQIDPLPYMFEVPDNYAAELAIEEIIIPENIRRISDFAFNSCHSLKKVIIEEGCEYIGDSAFGNCSELTEVYLPKSLTLIDLYCFADCPKLMKIHYAGRVADWEIGVEEGLSIFHNSGISEIVCSDDIYVIK